MSSPAEHLIRDALQTIADVWDATLDPPAPAGAGGASGPQESQTPMPIADTETRSSATRALHRHAGRIRDGLDLCILTPSEHGPRVCLRRHQTLPVGYGVPALAGWMQPHSGWLAVVEPDAVLDLVEAAVALDRIAHPDRPDSLYIGRCTVGADVDPSLACNARLYWPTGAVELTCPSCGMTDTLSGWERRVVGPSDQLHALAPVPGSVVILFVASRFGRVVTDETLRQWVARRDGKGGRTPTGVARHGKDGQGRALYNLGEVRDWCAQLWP